MKVLRAMLHPMLMEHCAVTEAQLEGTDLRLATVLGVRMQQLGPEGALSELADALKVRFPAIDWHWLSPDHSVDDLARYAEILTSASLPAHRDESVRWEQQSACSRETHAQNLLWGPQRNFALLLHGLGGQSTGASASSIALLGMLEGELEARWSLPLEARLHARATAMDAALRQHNDRGLRAHFAAVEVTAQSVGIAQVGSPEVFRVRGQKVEALSADDSLAGLLHASGIASDRSPEEARDLYVRALGEAQPTQPTVRIARRCEGDRYLLIDRRGDAGRVGIETLMPMMRSPWSAESLIDKLREMSAGRWELSLITLTV